VTNALSPAKVQRVTIVNDLERVMEVVVEDKQLSLAIGKKGQNVRLAAKLTGWKIDIKSEEEKRREVEVQLGKLELGEVSADAEAEAGSEAAEAEQTGELQASDAGAVDADGEALAADGVAADGVAVDGVAADGEAEPGTAEVEAGAETESAEDADSK